MGTWGTGISSNDSFADIYDTFIELHNEGLSVSEITKKLIEENQETINTPEDANDFWFALAKGQWECKELDKDILSKIQQIVLSGADLKIREELGATKADLKAREKTLTKFLSKLQTPKSKPRKRKQKKLISSIFKKGDCLIYKMSNNNYGGAFVLTEEKDTLLGINAIVITTIDKSDKPTLEDFEKAEIYVQRRKDYTIDGKKLQIKDGKVEEKWKDEPCIMGYFGSVFKTSLVIVTIGQLPIYKEYKIAWNMGYSGWDNLGTAIPNRDKWIEFNGKPEKKVYLSEWTEKGWFKGWL